MHFAYRFLFCDDVYFECDVKLNGMKFRSSRRRRYELHQVRARLRVSVDEQRPERGVRPGVVLDRRAGRLHRLSRRLVLPQHHRRHGDRLPRRQLLRRKPVRLHRLPDRARVRREGRRQPVSGPPSDRSQRSASSWLASADEENANFQIDSHRSTVDGLAGILGTLILIRDLAGVLAGIEEFSDLPVTFFYFNTVTLEMCPVENSFKNISVFSWTTWRWTAAC